MSSPIDPIRGVEKKDDDLSVDAIDPNSKRKSNEQHEDAPPNELLKVKKSIYFYSASLSFLKKIFPIFKKTLSQSNHTLAKNLLILKNLLSDIQRLDQSKDPLFTQKLSQTWYALLEEANLMTEPDSLNLLLKTIDTFPQKGEHSLGFYLTKCAGEKWLPAPFMTILKELHLEHKTSGKNSQLSKWIKEIKDLL